MAGSTIYRGGLGEDISCSGPVNWELEKIRDWCIGRLFALVIVYVIPFSIRLAFYSVALKRYTPTMLFLMMCARTLPSQWGCLSYVSLSDMPLKSCSRCCGGSFRLKLACRDCDLTQTSLGSFLKGFGACMMQQYWQGVLSNDRLWAIWKCSASRKIPLKETC